VRLELIVVLTVKTTVFWTVPTFRTNLLHITPRRTQNFLSNFGTNIPY